MIVATTEKGTPASSIRVQHILSMGPAASVITRVGVQSRDERAWGVALIARGEMGEVL